MTPRQDAARLIDRALKDRLHFRTHAEAKVRAVRRLIGAVDTLNRLLAGRPFFALNEAEEILAALDGRQGTELIAALLALKGGTQIRALGLDHVPGSGPVVIAATHSTGILDFIAHASALLPLRPDLKVVANADTEKFLGPDLILPVRFDPENRAISGKASIRLIDGHLSGGGALLIFGSGRVPDRKRGYLVEPPWKKGASAASRVAGAPVIPAALAARNSDGYYRTRALVRFLTGGNDTLGARIAALRYLAEFIDKLGGSYDVHYGGPLPPGTPPDRLKAAAERLVPALYGSGEAAGNR